MTLQKQIEEAIKNEAEKLIVRYHQYHNRVSLVAESNSKRLGESAKRKQVYTPEYWSHDKKFNPFYVKKHYKSIAHAIAMKIQNRTYVPGKPYIKEIPKVDGGIRHVTIYQIQDAAISKLFFNRLLAKNKHRFSSFSYAYRNDRNVHFAIQDISVDLKRNERTFVAEFDFSDFFGSISHSFLYNQFDQNGFYISSEEIFIIKSFLKSRKTGIPQGTSISLFLANLTCWKLDQNFEREGLKFSRYADDTIVWSTDYNKICKAVNLINDFSKEAKVKINLAKSSGISLLTKPGFPSEIESKVNLDFLGYSLSVDKISIKSRSLLKIKKQISYLLYKNLIQPLKCQSLAGQHIPANGRDSNLLSAICEIRRYLYGNLDKKQIYDYLSGRRKHLYFKGIMSFYPLVNDEKQLEELDGWIISIIYRSLKVRNSLLKKWNYDRSYSFPFNVSKEQLVSVFSHQSVNGRRLYEIPSTLLIYRALQKGLLEMGIETVMHPESLEYNY
ncbi:reverse transcriptase domain-containing protein [Wohlfahrtiimonas populi]|uniref:reverse transcriptase domain-containing protein n=1 Tax=Wohlfahrtiimonas populi TaxID=1940240 RepID=UPI00098D4A33|nr:reverse transcriptase domain-containing protein [Wohlfahrtiimonas populi]